MDDNSSKVKFVKPEIIIINIAESILNEMPEGSTDKLYVFAFTDS